MERKKNILILIIIILFSARATAQNNKIIYNAYVNNEMLKWKKLIDGIEQINQKPNTLKLELLNYQYGYIGWCIAENRDSEARNYLSLAKNNLEALEDQNYKLADLYAYKSAFIGYEVALSPYKAPFIGMRSIGYAETSIELDKNNYLGYLQLGNARYYMPSALGGSKTEAINHYKKALQKMENNPGNLDKNWNYLNLLATLVNAYIETENFSNAEYYSNKALNIAPDFDWVKNELHPKILKELEK